MENMGKVRKDNRLFSPSDGVISGSSILPDASHWSSSFLTHLHVGALLSDRYPCVVYICYSHSLCQFLSYIFAVKSVCSSTLLQGCSHGSLVRLHGQCAAHAVQSFSRDAVLEARRRRGRRVSCALSLKSRLVANKAASLRCPAFSAPSRPGRFWPWTQLPCCRVDGPDRLLAV